MDRLQLLELIRQEILALNEHLEPDEVTELASLTSDLGMDSFLLESLISALKEELGEIEFTPWYARAARRGGDTVGGLVSFIVDGLGEQSSAMNPETPSRGTPAGEKGE
jgi:acyl carrier protein